MERQLSTWSEEVPDPSRYSLKEVPEPWSGPVRGCRKPFWRIPWLGEPFLRLPDAFLKDPGRWRSKKEIVGLKRRTRSTSRLPEAFLKDPLTRRTLSPIKGCGKPFWRIQAADGPKRRLSPIIVDFPLKMVIFHSYVSLPEGILYRSQPSEPSGRGSLAPARSVTCSVAQPSGRPRRPLRSLAMISVEELHPLMWMLVYKPH